MDNTRNISITLQTKKISMDNRDITVERSLSEQHHQNNSQHNESLPRNQTDLPSSKKENRMAKKGPMHPTPLEYSWCSTNPRTAAVCAYVLFTILAMSIGILIVCFTSPKPRVPECKFQLRPTVQYSSRDSSHPQSAAVADFDSDGRIDIVVANSGFDNISIHFGYDNGSFANPVKYSMGTGSAPRMVAVGDFNNDTLYDVVVTNFGTNNIIVLFGTGDGNFSSQTSIETSPSRPVYVIIANFNNDHCSDLAFIGYGTDSIGVLVGFCNGTFETPMYFSTGYDSISSSIAAGDFDNDGQLDIAVANYGTHNLGVFLGYGNGTFQNPITYSTSSKSGPYSIAVTDLNSDTYLDIAVVCSHSNVTQIFFGHRNGSFTRFQLYSSKTNSNPIFIAIEDFNNDNNADIAVVNNDTNTVMFFLGNGDGIFANPAIDSTGPRSSPCSIVVADFNSNNQLDIAIVNQQNNNIKLFESTNDQVFTNPTMFYTINNDSSIGISYLSPDSDFDPVSVVMDDFNNDGYLDVAAASYSSDCMYIFLTYGDGRFAPPTTYSTGHNSGPWSITTADFNNDGQLDVAVANSLANNIGIFLGNDDGEFSPQIIYFTGDDSGPTSVVAGDFNNDGCTDIAATHMTEDKVGVFLLKDDGQSSSQITYFTGTISRPCSLAVADFNNDRRLDIAFVNYYTGASSILLGYGDGKFSSPTIYSTGYLSAPIYITIGDFNNDGRTDIAVANYNSDNIGVFLARSLPELSPQTSYFSGAHSGPRSIIAADFNNDGHQDIAIANYHTDNIGVFLGSRIGNFSFQMTYSTGVNSGPTSLISGDFNSDGRLDFAVANSRTDNVGVFLASASYNLASQAIYSTGTNSCPVSIVSGDFNSDGRLDIAVANSHTDNVGLFLGSSSGNFSSQTTCFIGTSSSPISIIAGDFNNDGRLDLAVANNGTNNVVILLGYGNGDFSAPRSYSMGRDFQPTSIVAGDFNSDGRLDFVVASYWTGNISVFLGYANEFFYQTTYFIGTDSSPILFLSIDYNKDGYLDIAFTDCRRDNVGFILGYGNGQFSFSTTYSTGIGSSPTAVAIRDFNKDGQLDIAIANYGTDNVGVFLSYKTPDFSPHTPLFTGDNSRPTSIVAGDFNNDGRLDIAVANSLVDNVGIFLYQGNDEFSRQITYSTGHDSEPISVVAGDFNNDGPLDIAVANSQANNFGIFLGDGNGQFSTQKTYSTGINSQPVAIVAADFDNDGRLDIAVANYRSDNVGVFLGYDNGEFSSQTTYFTGRSSGPMYLVAGDLNNDGRLDIVIANNRSNNIGVFLANNSGRFTSQTTYSTGYNSHPYSLTMTDINNDGAMDIIVANYATNNIGVFLGYSNGELSSQVTFFVGNNARPTSIATGDCDNDGRQDIFVTNSRTASVTVFLGYSNGKFSSQTVYPSDYHSGPYCIILADFNNDGRLDIALANYAANSIGLIFGHATRLFVYEKSYNISMNFRPKSIDVCDFNNDGQLDIAVLNDAESKLHVMFGHGTGEFSIETPNFTLTAFDSYSMAAGDFNSDGQKDIVVANRLSDNIEIFLGDGRGDFSIQMAYSTGNNSSPIAAVTADFNNDGRLDIAVANYQSDSISIFLGGGNGGFLPQMSVSTGTNSGPHSIIACDFNNDGQLDVAVANYRTNNVGILLGDGKGYFSVETNFSTGSDSGPYALATGDLNNDGHVDLAVTNHHTHNVGVILGHGDGQFSPQTTYFTGDGSFPCSIIIADLNNDGRLDIAITNYGTNTVGIFLGYDNNQFSLQTTYSTDTNSGPVALVAGDLNRDGRLDIVVANNGTNKLDIFLGFNSIQFNSQTTYSTGYGSSPQSIVTDDLNNDGRLDLVVADSETNNVGIFLGHGNGQFLPQATYFMSADSHPHSLTVTDFDNDDRLDIVVVNRWARNIALLRGQGTGHFPYITYSPKRSFCSMLVTVGDVNNDGQLDIVAANYDTDSVCVLLGHGDGIFANPSVLSTGKSSSPIAIAVDDIDGDRQLDIAVANLDAKSVGVFFGHGNGSFKSLSAFSTGVRSCPVSLAVGDFNDDGRFDIVVADPCTQNIIFFIDYNDGKFSSKTTKPTPIDFAPIWIRIADFNNDNRLDIVAVSYETESVGILLRSDDDNFQRWSVLSTGSYTDPLSLALGDFNNDGNMDIAVINSRRPQAHILILLGEGDGNFSNNQRYFTNDDTKLCSMVVANWNEDSHLDIAVVDDFGRIIRIFLGNGDGSFSRHRNYSVGHDLRPISAAAGDFNKDNLTDLVVANNGTYAVAIFLGHIQTNFVERSTFPTGAAAFPGSIGLGDFTSDGLPDLLVGNDGLHNIIMFINGGNGKFSTQIAYSGNSTFFPTSIIVSDFNNDQRLDAAVANADMNTLTLLYGLENGTFDTSTNFFTGISSNPQSVAVGDFNNDNKTDIVVAHSGTGNVGLLLRIDNGALQNSATPLTEYSSKPRELIVADFDDDGHLDIAFINSGNISVGFLFGVGDGTFSEQNVIVTGQHGYRWWMSFGDFNNDKRLDIIVSSNISPSRVIVLFGNGDRSFRLESIDGFKASEIGSVGDFNSDGNLDVAFCLPDDHAVVFLLGNGNGTFRNSIIYSTGDDASPSSIVVGDFNNDTRLDIAVGNYDDRSIGVFLGYGNSTFSYQTISVWSYRAIPISLTTGDFNNDGWLDIAVGFIEKDDPGILFGYGDGTFWPVINFEISDTSLKQSIKAADLNNDGRLDVIFTDVDNGKLSIFLGHINGTFFNEISYFIGDNSFPDSIGLGDFNNDGRFDVAVCDTLSDNIVILLGYDNEDFTSTAPRSAGNSSQPVSVAVGDFNDDACLDVVVADRANNQIVILRGSGYGTFLDEKTYSTGDSSNPSWIAVDHFNQDQHLDIVVANTGTHNIGVFLGFGSGTFSSIITSSTGDFSSPVSLTVSHFDNDNHLDIAVANFDANNVCILFGYGNGSFGRSVCRTSGYDSRPFAVASGDVNGDNMADVVIANKRSSTIEILTNIC